MALDPDIQLAGDFNTGDKKAFEIIFNRFYSQLYEFCYGLTRDSEEVKDIVSLTFTNLFAKHKDFDNLPNIKAFLYIAVRNRSIDHLRQRKVKTERDLEIMAALKTQSISRHMIDGELLSQLSKSIEALPDRSKTVIKMLYYDKMKYEEIAKELQISIETVKSQRKYAIEKLRKYLQESKLRMVIALLLLLHGY